MCGNPAVLAMCAVLVLGLPSLPMQANEKPTEAYQKAMKELDAVTRRLPDRLRLLEREGDCCYEFVEADAVRLKAAFATVLDFWTERKADAATLRLAQNAAKDAAELERASKAKHYDGVIAAQGAILGSCMPCHTAHRERLPDGTFEIK